MENVQDAALPFSGLGLMFSGLAMVLRERYRGKALLIRAERGDPEQPRVAWLSFPRGGPAKPARAPKRRMNAP